MKNPVVINLMLLLVAVIWGFGFVPQRLGLDYFDPSFFNAMRFALGALALVPLMVLMQHIVWKSVFNQSTIRLGFGLGFLVFGGAYFQQISLQYTSVANVAFITSLYVILVPSIGYFIGYRYSWMVWLGGVIAIIGLYLMTGTSTELSLKGDILALLGAGFWALHILLLAKRAGAHNQVALAFLQFVFCALLSLAFALIYEERLLSTEIGAYQWPLLNGLIVVGVGYTLQVLILDKAEPFSASLILSLEAVFGALAGYLVFSERLAAAALIGAVMIFLGCIMAQLPNSQAKGSETKGSRS